MKTAAVYIRVSTDDQIEYSPSAQLAEIRKYAASHDFVILDSHIYIDEGISGRFAKKRPGFNSMIASAKSKEKPFDVILLWKFSRFARNQEESIVYKSLLRKQLGIDVISVSEPLIDGPFGGLIERIIEWMDEYYSIRLAGEVRRGMTEKATRGEIQTIPSFGYNKPRGQAMTINEEEAKWVRYIFNQYISGATMFSLSTKLNDMGIHTKRGNKIENRQIEYMLNNPIYKGYVRWSPSGKTVSRRIYNSPDTMVVRSTHPPIIDEDTWNNANARYWDERRQRTKYEKPAELHRHYLSGILRCAECGGSMTYSEANAGFQCINYAHGKCKSHFISSSKIEAALIHDLRDLCRSDRSTVINVRAPRSTRDDERDLLRSELASLDKMMERCRRAYIAGIDSMEDYGTNKTMIQNDMKRIIKQINEIPIEIVTVNQDALKARIRTVVSILSGQASYTEKRSALSGIVEKVTFSRPSNNISIYFVLM